VKKTLILLGAGCMLVGVLGVVMLIIDGDFKLFAIVNGALAILLLILFRGSVTGADKRRPPAGRGAHLRLTPGRSHRPRRAGAA
jgi:predicted lysophospholipase L1 biosynthesis ABC-type transport system permease subunit